MCSYLCETRWPCLHFSSFPYVLCLPANSNVTGRMLLGEGLRAREPHSLCLSRLDVSGVRGMLPTRPSPTFRHTSAHLGRLSQRFAARKLSNQ
jgi:hypothetical protein